MEENSLVAACTRLRKASVAALPRECDGVIRALRAHPELARQTSSVGRLPLHLVVAVPAAVAGGAGERHQHTSLEEVLLLLLSVHPVAATIPDPFGGAMPLHTCLKQGVVRTCAAVTALLEAIAVADDQTQCGAARRDRQGVLPLHRALRVGRLEPEALMRLIAAAPAASAGELDPSRGWTSLHFVARYAASCGPIVVAAILELAPDAIDRADQSGRNPLHLAVANRSPLPALSVLLAGAGPEALSMSDRDGHTPVQIAVRLGESENPPGVLEALLVASRQRGEGAQGGGNGDPVSQQHQQQQLAELAAEPFLEGQSVAAPASEFWSPLRSKQFVRGSELDPDKWWRAEEDRE